MENPTIFSRKETIKRVQFAFIDGIKDKNEKLKTIENWQQNLLSGKFMLAKEEELQSLFLLKIFGDVLGYEYNNPNEWNIKIENKSTFDSSKSDGALGYFKIQQQKETENDVRVVIELKNARTSLDKPQNRKDFKGTPVEQAFAYASKLGSGCKWVIVSNFIEIRLYLANDINKYESFDFYSLTDEDEFNRFYYILSKGNLFQRSTNSVVDDFLQTRIEKEQKIGKEFYVYYKTIREQFFYHLSKNNEYVDSIVLLQFAQTIIDRIVFISIIKDYGLISYDVVQRIQKIASESWEKDEQELWRQLIKLFKALDEGFPPRVHQFNGGLFKQNIAIDQLIVKDAMLNKLLKVTSYDFESDLSINILGHIFEQSISDLENLKAQIRENKISNKSDADDEPNRLDANQPKGKRKKEGVFYTPENITKYIVGKSVGAWLDIKKQEIGIDSIQETAISDNEKKLQLDLWYRYIDVLKRIKVIDPACGSGAFLTQTFDYLYNEWRIVVSEIKKLSGVKPVVKKQGQLNLEVQDESDLSDWKIRKQIVTNNLYGVDLNNESVEITKLGLWIKTVNKNDSLASLDTNIKTGNSLIGDHEIADSAFVWEKEFYEIFQNGGFDVIVGNPPYVVVKGGRYLGGYQYTEAEIDYIKKNYQTAQQQINTYTLFIEQSIRLLNPTGYLSFIIPNTFLANEYSQKFREFILKNTHVVDINNVGAVFEDANVETLILTLKHQRTGSTTVIFNGNQLVVNLQEISELTGDSKFLIAIDENTLPLIRKMQLHPPLSQFAKVWRGLTTGDDSKYISEVADKDQYRKLLSGKEIQRYYYHPSHLFVYYDAALLDRARDERIFLLKEKLVSKFVGNKLTFCYDDSQYYVSNTGCITELINNSINIKYLLALLNSSPINFYFQTVFTDYRETFPIMKSGNIEQLPIPIADENIQTDLAAKADKLLELNKRFNVAKKDFSDLIVSQLGLTKLNSKLENWHELKWDGFSNELTKAKIKNSLQNLKEWKTFFTDEQAKVNEIEAEINRTELDVDNIVFGLYGIDQFEREKIRHLL